MFREKGILRNFTKFARKHLCLSFFFDKVAGLRLWHSCFPVNFVKLLRAPFLQNTTGRLRPIIFIIFVKLFLPRCLQTLYKLKFLFFFNSSRNININKVVGGQFTNRKITLEAFFKFTMIEKSFDLKPGV